MWLTWMEFSVLKALAMVRELRANRSVAEVNITRVGLRPKPHTTYVKVKCVDDLMWAYQVDARLRKGFVWNERLREGWMDGV